MVTGCEGLASGQEATVYQCVSRSGALTRENVGAP